MIDLQSTDEVVEGCTYPVGESCRLRRAWSMESKTPMQVTSVVMSTAVLWSMVLFSCAKKSHS